MFAKAKEVTKAAPAKKKNTKPEFEVQGLEKFALIKSMIASLEAVAAGLEQEVKENMVENFKKRGLEQKKNPGSFIGLEGVATASCELRKRGTRSPLTQEEIDLLAQNKIPTEVKVSQVGTYIINPSYKDDEALLEKVSKALSKVGLPEDFIQFQAQVETTVVTDRSIDEVFVTGKTELLSLVSVPAVKPKVNNTDNLKKVYDAIFDTIGIRAEVEVEDE